MRRRARSAISVTMPVSELTTISSAATSMVQYQTLPDVEAFVKIAEPAQEPATLLFDFGPAILPVDGHHGASAGSGIRHLDLIGIVVIVRRRRSDAQLFAEVTVRAWPDPRDRRDSLSRTISDFAMRGSLNPKSW